MGTTVVGVDDSAGARAALSWAAQQAAATGTSLRVVHAYDLALAWIDADSADIPTWRARAEESAERTANKILDEVLGDAQAESLELRIVEGDPADVLHHESGSAELVVVGTRGHGGFAGLLLGSVSQRVAQHSACPVVIVPTPTASDAP